jgi:hypothetical protein
MSWPEPVQRVAAVLEHPPTLKSAVPDWRPGDTIPLGRRTLRVVGVRPAEDPDGDPVLVIEDPDSKGH